jgi:hypothetical protein
MHRNWRHLGLRKSLQVMRRLRSPCLKKSAPVSERKRFNQTTSLKDRLAAFAEEARDKAKSLHGAERDALLKKARRADTAAHIDDWVNSSGLQPPK